MMASEACPLCRKRTEGKPTLTSISAGSGPDRDLPRFTVPRWGFVCTGCQYEWLAEPVSRSLWPDLHDLGAKGQVVIRPRQRAPYHGLDEFHPHRSRLSRAMLTIGRLTGLRESRT